MMNINRSTCLSPQLKKKKDGEQVLEQLKQEKALHKDIAISRRNIERMSLLDARFAEVGANIAIRHMLSSDK